MSKRWLQKRKRDHYYRRAKQENYRSRAAFKLKQINTAFRIFRPGYTVIDLGANPGGWSQVAAELVGEKGVVIAVDLKPIEPIPGVTVLRGDARSLITWKKIKRELPGGKANVVISDMAPNISGNYSLDHARSMELAEMALECSLEFLRPGGSLVVKVFDGDMASQLFRKIKTKFMVAKRHSPKASRKSSSEIYMIGIGYK